MAECSIDFCDRAPARRGYCKPHYDYMWRRGEFPKRTPRADGCSVEGCDWTPSPGRWLRKGMCQSHYAKSRANTLHREQPDPLIDDDQVRSLEDLPTRKAGIRVGTGNRWAVLMPYPSFDGTQACAGDLTFADEPSPAREQTCKQCPFRQSCFEWAMAHEEFGFWAGVTASRRAEMRQERGQALVTPQLGGNAFPDRNWSTVLDELANPTEWVYTEQSEEDWYGDEPVYQ
jgi:hypothetical protein